MKKTAHLLRVLSVGILSMGLSYGAYAQEGDCALDTDCQIAEYNNSIVIPNIEKADYQCHIKQTDISNRHPIHTIYISNGAIGIAERDFGGYNAYEGNIYVTANKLYPNRNSNLLIGAKQPRYSDYYYLFKPLSSFATITVHCKKIWSPTDETINNSYAK
jgi:hypothetical protein